MQVMYKIVLVLFCSQLFITNHGLCIILQPGQLFWGVMWDPDLGPRFGTLIWGVIWDPNYYRDVIAGHYRRASLRSVIAGCYCGTLLLAVIAGYYCRT
jgi:hypothetical protein